MNQHKHKQFPLIWAAAICILSFFLFYQTGNSDASLQIHNETEAEVITEFHLLPILIPGQVEGTLQHHVIRNLPKTNFQKADILHFLQDCYFSKLALKISQSSCPENFLRKVFTTSIFSNAP